MKRLYGSIIRQHFQEEDLMLFLSGPRQVGKTTISRDLADVIEGQVVYFNWDDEDHKEILLQGPEAIMRHSQIEEMTVSPPLIIFDEIHKHPDWKNFLKGFFDSYGARVRIIVTGSSRLDVFKKGGDSLMGRYFPYRMHPLSVGECIHKEVRSEEILPPSPIDEVTFTSLFNYGGFPKPFLKRNSRFSHRWQRLRWEQLLREDIRDVTQVQEIGKLDVLATILSREAGHQLSYSNLAKMVRVSVDTITRWVEILQTFYFCFLIRPWSKNISRSLIKEPKVFLWDWSIITDPGSRTENFMASHLLKAVHYWTDMGLGEYGLYYLRDLEKREVDFVVTKNGKPWFFVEVKKGDNSGISKSLYHFCEQTGVPHAFQVVLDKPYIDKDCFSYRDPVIVPARTFLSQLV